MLPRSFALRVQDQPANPPLTFLDSALPYISPATFIHRIYVFRPGGLHSPLVYPERRGATCRSLLPLLPTSSLKPQAFSITYALFCIVKTQLSPTPSSASALLAKNGGVYPCADFASTHPASYPIGSVRSDVPTFFAPHYSPPTTHCSGTIRSDHLRVQTGPNRCQTRPFQLKAVQSAPLYHHAALWTLCLCGHSRSSFFTTHCPPSTTHCLVQCSQEDLLC
jgi:hypothetical protein